MQNLRLSPRTAAACSQNRRSVTFSSRSKRRIATVRPNAIRMTIWMMQWTLKAKSPWQCNNPWKKSQQKKREKDFPISKRWPSTCQTCQHGTARQVQELSTVTNSKNDRDGSKLETNQWNSFWGWYVSGESKVLHSNTAIQNGASTKISPILRQRPRRYNNALSLELEGVKASRTHFKRNVKWKLHWRKESKLKDELSQALKRSNEDRQREQNDFETKFANVKRFWKWKSCARIQSFGNEIYTRGRKIENQGLEEQNRKNSINYADSLQAQLGSQRQKYEMKLTSFKMM